MKLLPVLLVLALSGCATIEGGPRRTAENVCSFLFLAGKNPLGLIGAALCAFGPDEIPEEDE